mgnify:CR=1 FL=1
MISTEQQRRENRRRHPEIAAFIDELRAHFGTVSVKALAPRRTGLSEQERKREE